MNKRYIASILIAIMTVSLVFTGCGGDTSASSSSTSDYKAVVKTFMGAIHTQNTAKLLNCFQKDDKADILDNVDEEDLKSALEECDADISDDYGDDWSKNITVSNREKQDESDDVISYIVSVQIGDEDFGPLPIIKVGSKYFMDPAVMDNIVPESTSGGPEDIVGSFFDSISQGDSELFLGCFTSDAQDAIFQNVDETQLGDTLVQMNQTLVDEYGDDWRDQLVIGQAEKDDSGDTVYYNVTATMNGEDSTIQVLEVDGVYYLDESSIEGMF